MTDATITQQIENAFFQLYLPLESDRDDVAAKLERLVPEVLDRFLPHAIKESSIFELVCSSTQRLVENFTKVWEKSSNTNTDLHVSRLIPVLMIQSEYIQQSFSRAEYAASVAAYVAVTQLGLTCSSPTNASSMKNIMFAVGQVFVVCANGPFVTAATVRMMCSLCDKFCLHFHGNDTIFLKNMLLCSLRKGLGPFLNKQKPFLPCVPPLRYGVSSSPLLFLASSDCWSQIVEWVPRGRALNNIAFLSKAFFLKVFCENKQNYERARWWVPEDAYELCAELLFWCCHFLVNNRLDAQQQQLLLSAAVRFLWAPRLSDCAKAVTAVSKLDYGNRIEINNNNNNNNSLTAPFVVQRLVDLMFETVDSSNHNIINDHQLIFDSCTILVRCLRSNNVSLRRTVVEVGGGIAASHALPMMMIAKNKNDNDADIVWQVIDLCLRNSANSTAASPNRLKLKYGRSNGGDDNEDRLLWGGRFVFMEREEDIDMITVGSSFPLPVIDFVIVQEELRKYEKEAVDNGTAIEKGDKTCLHLLSVRALLQ
eukprot:PhM_4_TR10454/c1_g1_i1/m.21270